MATRHQVRQGVVSLLYANEFNAQNDESINEFLEQKKVRNEQKAFAIGLYNGVCENVTQLDKHISPFVKEESKVSQVERAILRLSAYEFFYSNTDKAVIINEAVELAKELASENSPKFINAVLDALKGTLQ